MNLVEEIYQRFRQFPRICTDSRKIIPGSIFFALKGPNHDGNQYAEEAISKGAAYACVSDPELDGPRFFVVEDTLRTLQDLARHHRDQFKIPVLGITGSNGKTTTRGVVESVMRQKFRTHATKGNLNNHIGVPLTILEMPLDTEFAIIEMGANHVGEIADLCRIADPDAGLITCIGKAHLEGFGGIEGVFRGKSELYEYVREKQGTIFLNAEDKYLRRHLGKIDQVVTYGHAAGYAVCTTPIGDEKGIRFTYTRDGQNHLFESSLHGAYNLINLTAALAVGLHYHIPLSSIREGITQFEPIENRSQIIQVDGKTIVLDAYNANPSSMQSAIGAFESSFGKGMLILGDMKELGKESLVYHQQLVDGLAEQGWQNVILIGEEFGKTNRPEGFGYYPDLSAGMKHINIRSINHPYILIKGSRSMRLEELIR